MVRFADRAEAGRRLAPLLEHCRGQDVVVLGLPRGGVPVAAEVAAALDAPLDVIVVRKLGLPSRPELAMGAIGEGGARVLNAEVLGLLPVPAEDLDAVERRERAQLEERVARLRVGRPRVDLSGRVALLVDDGIATGSTMRVACAVARDLGAARVVVAVPVASAESVRTLPDADEVVVVATPRPFFAVGNHYRDFRPTSDEEVSALLDLAARRRGTGTPAATGSGSDLEARIPVGPLVLQGLLHLPDQARGAVLFAHGSGSSRRSPRNRFVAGVLQQAGFGTLLLDLLTPQEERLRTKVFDIELLAGRLTAATRWLRDRPGVATCPIGYFGASTGAGAALWAAAELGPEISAVVSRGGRPDLAADRLAAVRAPTLLIVGGADTTVLELNRRAQRQLCCPNDLAVVQGATHLFEEPGTLAEAAGLARDWFSRHLRPAPSTG